jgi:hypothetical protein
MRPPAAKREDLRLILIASTLLPPVNSARRNRKCESRTTFHLLHFVSHLPEIVLQTWLYGYLLLAWERRAKRPE